MASVWKRLQRVNKRAAKFQYTASYHRIELETSPKWKPNKLSIVWTRRSRRVVTEPLEWEPSLKDPLKGSVIFPIPENHTVAVTLFKDSRTNELEDKDWTFQLDDVSSSGKRRRVASAHINMRRYASLAPAQFSVSVPLVPATGKVVAAAIHLTLHSVLLREGRATDEDMQSLASLLSVNNNSDVAVLDDLDDEDYTLSDHSTKQVLDFRQQMEEMTHSLTTSSLATPGSELSLTFDNCPTPTPASPATPPILQTDFTTSTPKTDTCQNDDSLKMVAFKPKTLAKTNLKPLDLKINLNSLGLDSNENDEDKTPMNEEKLTVREQRGGGKTPEIEEALDNPELHGEVAELLEWCQVVTRDYHAVKITDLSLSFRSGLPLCAIIHHFRPDLIDYSGLQPDDAASNVRVSLAAAETIGVSIDYSGLQPDDAASNVRVSLAAAETIGVSPVLGVNDVVRDVPDKLAIMTFLFQLRAHFTGNELQVEQLGSEECASSYVVGRHDTDAALPAALFAREVAERRSQRSTRAPQKRPSLLQQSTSVLSRALSPTPAPVSPTAKWFTDPPPRPEKLMTRKELTDPFASDDEEEQNDGKQDGNKQNPLVVSEGEKEEAKPLPLPELSPSARLLSDPLSLLAREQQLQQLQQQQSVETTDHSGELPKPTPQLLSRHDELKERARLLLEATKSEAREKEKRRQSSKEKDDVKSEIANGLKNGETSPTNKKPMTDEERKAVLRERARKLISDARAGIVSPTSPLSPSRASPQRGTVEVITRQSVADQIASVGIEQLDAFLNRNENFTSNPRSPQRSGNSTDNEDSISIKSVERQSPLKSFSALVENLNKDKNEDEEQGAELSYIQSEVLALEREQQQVDRAAAALERQLRPLIQTNNNTQEEDRLMSQWFNLVNKKNALLRRQMQLNILEQEEDLSRRCELLARELRLSLGVDEWRKTPGQKRRERLLLQELVSAVNERDRLVQEMDEQEKAIADDDEIERNLSQVEFQRKNNCILQ